MNRDKFNKLVEYLHKKRTDLMKVKGKEYSGDENVLSNFQRIAKEIGITPEQVWAVYFNKHRDSIMTYIRNGCTGVISEEMESRIMDEHNYLDILRALLYAREQDNKSEVDENDADSKEYVKGVVSDTPLKTPLTFTGQTFIDGMIVYKDDVTGMVKSIPEDEAVSIDWAHCIKHELRRLYKDDTIPLSLEWTKSPNKVLKKVVKVLQLYGHEIIKSPNFHKDKPSFSKAHDDLIDYLTAYVSLQGVQDIFDISKESLSNEDKKTLYQDLSNCKVVADLYPIKNISDFVFRAYEKAYTYEESRPYLEVRFNKDKPVEEK